MLVVDVVSERRMYNEELAMSKETQSVLGADSFSESACEAYAFDCSTELLRLLQGTLTLSAIM